MRVLCERCAAIDVGNAVVAVAVRLPGDGPDGRVTTRKIFKTFYGVLREAAQWLTALGVTHVAMEATGIYSMPVCHALLEHGRFEQVLVCNAGHVKNVPGRKTDLADAEWLAHLLECGLLRGSFVPPADIKAVRDVIRYRVKVVQARSAEIQRLGGVLQDAGIKLGNVASSLASKSGRNMIEALIDGERRPDVLADLAIGRMRSKTADLAMALEGRFSSHHALMCRLHLDHIAHLEQMIARPDAQVETMMQPYRAEQDLLATIPGIGPLAAAAIISEIGTDVRTYFPTAAHLGRDLPRQPRIGRQAAHRPAPPRQPEPRARPRRGRLGSDQAPGLPQVPPPPARHEVRRLPQQRRQEQGHHRRRPRHLDHRVARAGHRHPLPGTRCRLLRPPPGPRTRNPPPHRQTPSPRPPRHPGRRRLTHSVREADGTNRRRLLTRARLGPFTYQRHSIWR